MKTCKMILILLFILCTTTSIFASETKIDSINKNNPGEKFDIKKSIVPGKVNIFFFCSRFNKQSRDMVPRLKELNKKDKEIVVHFIDLDRKGATEPDWKSPLALQYKIKMIPYPEIFNKHGKLDAKADRAFVKLGGYLNRAGIK